MKLIQKSMLPARKGVAAPSTDAPTAVAAPSVAVLHVIARVILEAKEQQQQLHARKKIK